MISESAYFETDGYRCLVYNEKQTEDICLTMCGIEKCLPGYEFHTGDRGSYHLHVILLGRGELNVNGTQYSLSRGQMFITKPGEETWYRADRVDPWYYCWMSFDGRNAADYVEKAGFPKGINCRNCNIDQSQYFAVVKGLLDRPEMTLSNDIRRLALLLEFLSLAIEDENKKLPELRGEIDYNAERYVRQALDYIQNNFKSAKISEAAKSIGINRSYLTKIFKMKMGISPQEYLMQYKLNYACRLLRETDAPIQDISKSVGYDNLLTFSKIFKNRLGVSPKNYRVLKRGRKDQ